MGRHHHGYLWIGSGFDIGKDGPRRPAHPEFRSTSIMPLELAHWLLKPATFVRGTFHEGGKAQAWFAEQTQEHAGSFSSEHEREALDDRIAVVDQAVDGGQDVAGGWYLAGQRFLAVHLIACSPHRFRPEYACPLG